MMKQDRINPVLVEAIRGSITESCYRGAFAVADRNGNLLASNGDITTPIFPRSSIKTIQCLPLIETGAADHFSLSEQEIALACASHDGEFHHIEILEDWRKKLGLEYSALECGIVEPADNATRREYIKNGHTYSSLHAPCSGKHLGFLTTALYLKEPLQGYNRREHPVQQRVEKALEDMTGVSLKGVLEGIDGCRIPAFAFPLEAIAKAMAKMAAPGGLLKSRMAAVQRIQHAIAQNPSLLGGTNQFTSHVIEATQGRILIKVGAEGVFTVQWPERGLGIALKIESGSPKAAEVGIGALLKQLGAFTEAQEESLKPYLLPSINNNSLEPVGHLRPTFEWLQDISYHK